MDKDKLSSNVAAVGEEINETVEGLYDAIERLQTGNPRLSKQERETFKLFLHHIVERLSADYKLMQVADDLRVTMKETYELAKHTNNLNDTHINQLYDVLREVKRMISHRHEDDAFELIDKLLDARDNNNA